VLAYAQVTGRLLDTLAPDTVPYKKTDEGTRVEMQVKGDPKEALAKFQQAKFLQFTNSQGGNVLIAVDANNVPFFTNIRFGK
jgi:hypothetical protein